MGYILKYFGYIGLLKMLLNLIPPVFFFFFAVLRFAPEDAAPELHLQPFLCFEFGLF